MERLFLGSGDFFCLNQDFQDLRIYRMLLDDCFWEVGIFLSESGFSGFKDLQDVIEILFLGSGDFGKLGYFKGVVLCSSLDD